MSAYTLPSSSLRDADPHRASSDEEEDLTEDDFSDWTSALGAAALETKSLFDASVHASAAEALAHDSDKHGYVLKEQGERLGLSLYGRMRLVNLIRRDGLTPEQAKGLKGDGAWAKDDSLLKPVIVDDPLLQLDYDDSWSDDDEPTTTAQLPKSTSTIASDERVRALEAQLAKSRADLEQARSLLKDAFTGRESDSEDEEVGRVEVSGPGMSKAKGKGKARVRDDDTHYFDSYAENEIHEIMLRDTVRTVSYARFILSNPHAFKGKIVMDVGCGTGILSMFAAKAGAKQVFAIEASELASKARENVRRNGYGGVITVIQGKVEDISIPVDTVDVIISEWMGYMLLYESMLDSVLHARDRFLGPSGLMAPSQTRLVISGITADKVWKQTVGFWASVYGFDMSTMAAPYYGEGVIEPVDASEVVTDEAIVLDIDTHVATPKSLDFSSSFTLRSTSPQRQQLKAFLTHFDTFFSPTREPFASSTGVDIEQFRGNEYGREVTPLAGDDASGTPVSFTTGPAGKETHWKQVAFLLKEPVELFPGDSIRGRFYCRKSTSNSRELDVEIHYTVVKKGQEEKQQEEEGGEVKVQLFKVR